MPLSMFMLVSYASRRFDSHTLRLSRYAMLDARCHYDIAAKDGEHTSAAAIIIFATFAIVIDAALLCLFCLRQHIMPP